MSLKGCYLHGIIINMLKSLTHTHIQITNESSVRQGVRVQKDEKT